MMYLDIMSLVLNIIARSVGFAIYQLKHNALFVDLDYVFWIQVSGWISFRMRSYLIFIVLVSVHSSRTGSGLRMVWYQLQCIRDLSSGYYGLDHHLLKSLLLISLIFSILSQINPCSYLSSIQYYNCALITNGIYLIGNYLIKIFFDYCYISMSSKLN